jgi:FkbM family methyltransferase
MTVTIPSPSMPVFRRSTAHLLKLAPRLTRLTLRLANSIALVNGGRVQIAATFAGARMFVDITDLIGTCIFHFGVWEPHLSAFIQTRLKPSDVFCDVGANIGYHTLLAAPIVGESGKVVAIEASPIILQDLKRNVELNNATNIRTVAAAVADRACTLTLYRPPYANRGATTTVASRNFVPETEVQALPLGDILSSDEKKRVRLVKIDVEGAEGPIMQNLLETIDEYPDSLEILCEMSTTDTTPGAPDVNTLVKRFAEAGFRAFGIPNSYDLSSYPSFKRAQGPELICSPLTEQRDVVFSRHLSTLKL